jgi:hypothetical protein
MGPLNTGISLAQVFVGSIQTLLFQMINFLPKLVVAILIWWVGKYIIHLAVHFLGKIRFEGAKPVNNLVEMLGNLIMPFGKVVLFFVILDYLGIGRTVINALLSGLTFAVAIALGLAFSKAIEDDVKKLVDDAKKHLEK